MRKILFLSCIFVCNFLCAQITEQPTTPQALATLIPGFGQVSSISMQTMNFTYTPQTDPPTPIDGDTTTERRRAFKYGESIATNYSASNGNLTQTSEGKVWTFGIRMLGGAKNLGLTFDSLNLFTNTELYIYNESKTILMGPVKTDYIKPYSKLTTGHAGIPLFTST